MKFKEFIEQFKEKTQRVIGALEVTKTITGVYLKGEEKKARLDETMTKWTIEQVEANSKIKVIYKFIIKKFIIPQIPYITQMIFDLIKVRVEGITQEV